MPRELPRDSRQFSFFPGERGEASSVLSKSWGSFAFAAPHRSSTAKQELPLLGERVGVRADVPSDFIRLTKWQWGRGEGER